MKKASTAGHAASKSLKKVSDAVKPSDIKTMMDRYGYTEEQREIIQSENLLPQGLLARLQATYPQHSGLLETRPFLFNDRSHYEGLEGFREVVAILKKNGIVLDRLPERELFVQVYRFKATSHVLNAINWNNYQKDSLYQLCVPQADMMRGDVVKAYLAAKSPAEQQRVIEDYMEHTNPHDGHQLLNKAWMEDDNGGIDVLEGSQHKYPQCALIFDKSTQNCFSFCTYCFRHAQVRGDDDMFLQDDIDQVHTYMRQHPEITDLLITGGDAGYIPASRMAKYVMPIVEDPELLHVRTVRLASRVLTFQPELILSHRYDKMLELFDVMHEQGVQLAWMAHFSTPRELLNPSTIAAIRRLQRHGVVIRSQSPIMHHISLFSDKNGKVDIEKSAQNWIDLAHVFATLLIRFHSMYCARPTGEHHYFTVPLADIEKISNRIFRSLSSINRPSRYITMTTSAGKLSILGPAVVNGKKALALKFNESRNMEWMDTVFLANYDEQTNRVDRLTPLDTEKFFFEDELHQIEEKLHKTLDKKQKAPAKKAAAPAANGKKAAPANGKAQANGKAAPNGKKAATAAAKKGTPAKAKALK